MKCGLVFLMSTSLFACTGTPALRGSVAPHTASELHASQQLNWKQASSAQVAKTSGALAAKEPKEEHESEPQDFSGVDVAPPKDEVARVQHHEPDVEGIEGTMSEFDVNVALDGRDADFNQCHDEHRGASGRITFRIHVLSSGDVGSVRAHASHVRNKSLIECYSQVVSSTHFSKPHGGYADVKWTTKVGRSRKKADPIYDRPHRWDEPSGGKLVAETPAKSRRERHHHRHHSRKHHKHS